MSNNMNFAEVVEEEIKQRLSQYGRKLSDNDELVALTQKMNELRKNHNKITKKIAHNLIVFDTIDELVTAFGIPKDIAVKQTSCKLVAYPKPGQTIDIGYKCEPCGGYVLGDLVEREYDDMTTSSGTAGKDYHCWKCDSRIHRVSLKGFI